MLLEAPNELRMTQGNFASCRFSACGDSGKLAPDS